MDGAFEDVKLRWQTQEYTIPANRVLGAIARVEHVITLEEINRFVKERETVPPAILSQAFGTLLRYAGAQVTDGDIFSGMFGAEKVENVLNALLVLLAIMIPPSAMVPGVESAAENPTGGGEQPSLKRSTKQRSGKNG